MGRVLWPEGMRVPSHKYQLQEPNGRGLLWLAAGQKRAHWTRAGSEPVELSGGGVPTGQDGVPTGDRVPTGQGRNSLASEPSEGPCQIGTPSRDDKLRLNITEQSVQMYKA